MTRGRPSGSEAPKEDGPPRKAAPARKSPARAGAAPTRRAASGGGAKKAAATTAAAPGSVPSTPVANPGPAPVPAPPTAAPGSRRSGWRALADPSSPALIYAGVVAVVAGFALLFVAWSEVAAQADVWRQMPFVLSAGFPGLGLIMTGLVLASVGVRRQEGVRRQRQMAALTEALRAVEQRAG